MKQWKVCDIRDCGMHVAIYRNRESRYEQYRIYKYVDPYHKRLLDKCESLGMAIASINDMIRNGEIG